MERLGKQGLGMYAGHDDMLWNELLYKCAESVEVNNCVIDDSVVERSQLPNKDFIRDIFK